MGHWCASCRLHGWHRSTGPLRSGGALVMLAEQRTRGVAAVALVAIGLAGCGEAGKQSSDDQAGEVPSTQAAGIAETSSSSGIGPPESNTAVSSSQGSTGKGRVVRKSNGSVVLLPNQPREATTTPSPGCVTRRAARGSVSLPPQPGIRARRVGRRRVEVLYVFSSTPASCQPVSLALTTDSTRDSLGGDSTTVRVAGKTGQVTLRLPRRMRNADVVRATAMTKRGLPSESAAFQIR